VLVAAIVPTLRFERPLWRAGLERVVGVDEVGVAPTCGAVVAAAVVMRPGCHRIPGVRDSKTLSAGQRERLAPIIRRRAVAVGVGAASVAEIDRLNIYHATHLAMRRAIARLGSWDHVLVDGNRIAGFEAQVGPYTAIVDGDARCYSIACASVVAKVVRDRMMARLAARYPGYGWERNQGYATREHRTAIRRLGLTPFHRRSFLALQRTLAGDQVSFDLFDEGDRSGSDDDGWFDGRVPFGGEPLPIHVGAATDGADREEADGPVIAGYGAMQRPGPPSDDADQAHEDLRPTPG
jgi:ribonuclease HII